MSIVAVAGIEIPPAFAAIVPRVRVDVATHLGAPDAELRPLDYQNRPFSHVLRLEARTPDIRGRGVFFVKVFKSADGEGGIEHMRRRVAHDYDVTARVAAAMAHHEGLGVVRPVACYLDACASVTEEAPGITVTAYLERRAAWFPSPATLRAVEETLTRVGRWTREFQAIEPASDTLDLCALQEYVDIRLKRLVAGGVYTEPYRQRILRHLASMAELVPREDRHEVLIHADFAPGNILVAPDRVTVIDLAMVQRGSRLHDLSRLHLQLDVMRAKPQFRTVVLRRLQAALLRGFDPALDADRPLFRFLGMLHRINHLGTLSLKPERFPGAIFSRRVRRLHRAWIDDELRRGTAGSDPS